MNRLKAITVLIGAVLLLGAPTAQAVDVNFTITESYLPDGTETASAAWSSDAGAVFTVTRDLSRTDGEVWLIDLSLSGHQVPGRRWPFGFTVATWREPEHPGLWNNLYIDDSLHMHMESEWETATGQNMGSFPNGFGSGVSFYAGRDFNDDSVFARVVEVAVPEPATLSLLAIGGLALLRLRRRAT